MEIHFHGRKAKEAQMRVHEVLRDGLRDGTYSVRDFYPQDHHDVQLPRVILDAHELEDSFGQHCFGSVLASGEAIVGLPESANEGECSVCLENFEGSNKKLRVMPCSHSFHEPCIFNWLRISRVCPLCRFPLPTEQQ